MIITAADGSSLYNLQLTAPVGFANPSINVSFFKEEEDEIGLADLYKCKGDGTIYHENIVN